MDRIRNDANEDDRAGLRMIAEIIKRTPHETPDDDIVHLRRVMYDAGTGVSRHRLWLDARATEKAELSRIFGDKACNRRDCFEYKPRIAVHTNCLANTGSWQ
ncbi:hypothetical protein EDC04DRAFT_2903108 [Pisolithus marmoratus]|nr:hypothetical protein EDC04DRAFT_2903108 [Pisolithus marmoratus]